MLKLKEAAMAAAGKRVRDLVQKQGEETGGNPRRPGVLSTAFGKARKLASDPKGAGNWPWQAGVAHKCSA